MSYVVPSINTFTLFAEHLYLAACTPVECDSPCVSRSVFSEGRKTAAAVKFGHGGLSKCSRALVRLRNFAMPVIIGRARFSGLYFKKSEKGTKIDTPLIVLSISPLCTICGHFWSDIR